MSQRYSANDFGYLIPDQDGTWVRYSNVAPLERKIAELEAAISRPATEALQQSEPVIQWTDDHDCKHTMTLEGATETLKEFFNEWPGGMEEIEACVNHWRGIVNSLGIDAVKVLELSEYFAERNIEATGDWRSAVEDVQHRIDDLFEFIKFSPLPSQPEPLGQAMSDEDVYLVEREKFDAWLGLGNSCGCNASMWTAWQACALLHKAGASGRDANTELFGHYCRFMSSDGWTWSFFEGELSQYEDLQIEKSIALYKLSSQPSDDGRGK